MMDKIWELCSKKLPIKLAVAPRETKTSEKPKEKNKDFFEKKKKQFNEMCSDVNEQYSLILVKEETLKNLKVDTSKLQYLLSGKNDLDIIKEKYIQYVSINNSASFSNLSLKSCFLNNFEILVKLSTTTYFFQSLGYVLLTVLLKSLNALKPHNSWNLNLYLVSKLV